MTISALRPLDAKHVSAVATAAAKAPFLRGPGSFGVVGQEEWEEASPSGRGGTPSSSRRQWGSPPSHGFGDLLPEVAMDPMFEDVWEDTVAPLMNSFETQRKAMLHQYEHATKSFQDVIQKNIPNQMSLPKFEKSQKSN